LEIAGLLLSLVVVTPIVTLAFFGAYWRREKQGERLEVLWQAYARRRGLTFDAPSGIWPNRTPPVIRWVEEGGAYRIEARGAEAIATHVVARPVVALLGELHVTRKGQVLHAEPSALADRVLTPDVKRVLLGFDPESFSCQRGEIIVKWRGGEENDARLDEASALLRRVVNSLAMAS
jgi:hypothetical protein